MRSSILSLLIVFTFLACAEEKAPIQPRTHDGWESAFVESNGVRLHYWRTGGSDKSVMILAHGITDYGFNYASLAERFQDDYDVIMYDARGHGFSSKPDGPYDMATHVEDLAGLIKALGIKKPILMGHSMGGSTVGMTAVTYPDVPRAVIMEDPGDMVLLDRPLKPENIAEWKKMVKEDKETNTKKLIKHAKTVRHPGLPEIEYERWAESKKLTIPNVVDVVKGKGFGDPRETYEKIKVPTLILKADAKEDDRKKHQEIASHLPNGKLVHVDDTSHLIHLDQPEKTEQLIREFLSTIK